MNCVVILVCCVVGSALAEDHGGSKNFVRNTGAGFQETFARYYGKDALAALMKRNADGNSDDFKQRKKNYDESGKQIEDINGADKGWSAGYNPVTVMNNEEKAAITNLKVNETLMEEVMTRTRARRFAPTKRAVPNSVDWLERGAQPAIKNQGGCGSCWAFGAVSALEGNYFINTGDLVVFSEQEYLDCTYENMFNNRDYSWAEGKSGCSGAWMNWAYMYTEDLDRMATMAAFPYKAKDNACNMAGVANALTKMKVTGTQYVSGSDAKLKAAAAESLVTVAILVVNSFSVYRTGIYSCTGDCDCSTSINHAVTIVGYAPGYWNVRNSWGSNWGDGGYIKMSRAQDNICNINKYAQRPMMECRAGQNCTEPDWDDSDDGDGDDGTYDLGDIVQCGTIKHFGGKCVELDDTADKFVVLASICDATMCLFEGGHLQDNGSKLCIDEAGSGPLKFSTCDSDSSTWEKTKNGTIRSKDAVAEGWCSHANKYLSGYTSGTRLAYATVAEAQEQCADRGTTCGGITQEPGSTLPYTLRCGSTLYSSPSGETSWLQCTQEVEGDCWRPEGGSANPAEESKIITGGCAKSNVTNFFFHQMPCWEEVSGQKVGKKLKNSAGKPYKVKKLDDAQELCVSTKGCKSVYYSGAKKKYMISGAGKTKDSKNSLDKAYIQIDCDVACDAGLQRCDKECKEKCSDEDEDCPGGTVRCDDGVCKHEHMC